MENSQLKTGPGNACTIAKPNRKSRGDTHPSVTMYLKCGYFVSSVSLICPPVVSNTHCRKSGITTGPPPNMTVPARYILENSRNRSGRSLATPRKTITATKVARKPTMIAVPTLQETFNTLSSGTILGSSSWPAVSWVTLGGGEEIVPPALDSNDAPVGLVSSAFKTRC